ncbi:MAG: chemotaxis response regulator protein-glutamate methylesterase [Sedimentisphaerales bacterium]|nr:chemotaxis response regulator protein-glutamate methylesterase [Sedimentisphaerales bacterium]
MAITLNKTIKVLIVDDSAVVRKVLRQNLVKEPSIEIVGVAPDPYVARDRILELNPDVLVLDVEMPRMDGITFLDKLMRARPMPVIIFSSLTPKGSQMALEAMQNGAVDVVCKAGEAYKVGDVIDDLIDKIKMASRVNMSSMVQNVKDKPKAHKLSMTVTTNKIIAIGASTGGVQALSTVISMMPANAPGTVIVQHMPPKFTASFAQRLNEECSVNVKEARDGDSVVSGQVLIAPGGYHMVLGRSGANYHVKIKDGPRVKHQKPSVDVLFDSVSQYAGANAVGAILTGMGDDGAAGLLKMKEAGAKTIAQDEHSCIVYGMPAAAVKIGAADTQVALNKVAETLLNLCR